MAIRLVRPTWDGAPGAPRIPVALAGRPRQIFATLGITLPPPQPIQTRFDTLHFPKQMLNFRLLLAARQQQAASPTIRLIR